jgi:hypothetical protein
MSRRIITGAFSFLMLLATKSGAQITTVTDFSGNDCSGHFHHLYSELDSGKVIVLTFVMPCVGCADPSLAALATVQRYATSSGGKVVFYLADDNGDTPCSSLMVWANSVGLSHVPTFSDIGLTGTQYGSPAMPKIVVLGGVTHHVYAVQDDVVDTVILRNAINEALGTSIVQQIKGNIAFSGISPNPAKDKISVRYRLNEASLVAIELLNTSGIVVKTIGYGVRKAGDNDLTVDLDGQLPAGIYCLRLIAGGASEQMKFIVAE